MKPAVATGIVVTLLLSCRAWAASEVDDRLTLMASGSTLTHADNGGAAAVGWLHNFNASAILGAAAQYQTIANSHWTFGSLSLAYGLGEAAHRSNFYAEVDEGSGADPAHSYDYSIVGGGLFQNLTRQLLVQLEDKQIDIDTTHGNLPKVGVQFVWSPTLLTGVAYAHSVSGNLGTRLWSARIDRYGKTLNLIVGGATGKATPAVVDLQTGIRTPGLTLNEGFLGITKPFPRVEVTLLGDYLKIANIERVTLTLNCTVRLRSVAR